MPKSTFKKKVIERSCRRKKRYRYEGDAIHAASKLSKQLNKPIDVYWCQICNGWHLTSEFDNSKNPYLRRFSNGEETVNGS